MCKKFLDHCLVIQIIDHEYVACTLGQIEINLLKYTSILDLLTADTHNGVKTNDAIPTEMKI